MHSKKSNKTLLLPIIIILALSVMIVAGFIMLIPSKAVTPSDIEEFEGYKLLTAQETKDISRVDYELNKRKRDSDLLNMSVWEKLNYMGLYIMGDSRCVGFHLTDFDSNHNWSEASTTIKNIDDYLEDIEKTKPAYLMISYGMNDLGMYEFDPDNYWETGADYVEAFKTYTDKILSVSPDTKIMICSILPALEAGIVRQDRWLLVDDWNKTLEKFCEDEGFLFVDMTKAAEAHTDLYEDDGVHLNKDFYPIWADVIYKTIEESFK